MKLQCTWRVLTHKCHSAFFLHLTHCLLTREISWMSSTRHLYSLSKSQIDSTFSRVHTHPNNTFNLPSYYCWHTSSLLPFDSACLSPSNGIACLKATVASFAGWVGFHKTSFMLNCAWQIPQIFKATPGCIPFCHTFFILHPWRTNTD